MSKLQKRPEQQTAISRPLKKVKRFIINQF